MIFLKILREYQFSRIYTKKQLPSAFVLAFSSQNKHRWTCPVLRKVVSTPSNHSQARLTTVTVTEQALYKRFGSNPYEAVVSA